MFDLNKYSSVIWDWNGTIVDDSRLVFDIYREESETHNLEKMDFNEYKSRFYFPVAEFYEEVGLPKDKYVQIADRFAEVYRKKWSEIKVHPQVYKYLQKFKEAGLSQFILSAYEQNELLNMVKHFDLQNYFEEIAGISDNLAHSKTERGKKLFEKCKISPEKTVMFGDTDHDFEVAQELGIDVFIVGWGAISYDKLVKKYGGNIVFRDLDELLSESGK